MARLRWQCRRGMLELDELLLAFLELHYDALNSRQQQLFCRLLKEDDQRLFRWLLEAPQETPPVYQPIMGRIRDC